MILSGKKIDKEIENGNIFISDYHAKRLNPNSYNLRLHNEIMVYKNTILDMWRNNETEELQISERGMLLTPGKLYLARTVERTRTDKYIPMLEGRSSIGRLGLFIHVTAGFGDVGFNGFWTLELQCIQPIVIYPFVEICQIYYHTIDGEFDKYESGKYQNNNGIQSSQLWREILR